MNVELALRIVEQVARELRLNDGSMSSVEVAIQLSALDCAVHVVDEHYGEKS